MSERRPFVPRVVNVYIMGLAALALLVSACAAPSARPAQGAHGSGPAGARPAENPVPASIDDLQHRTFLYFWETADPKTGLVPDRYPTPSFSSMAANGFGLTAIPVGIERGWITRDAGAQRVLTALRFLYESKQGPDVHGTVGYKGFFYRYLDMDTGTRSGQIELSTVDTALLMGGVLFCGTYFDRDQPEEREIRRLADALYDRVEWSWMQVRGAAIAHGWVPDTRKAAEQTNLLVEGGAKQGDGPVPGHLKLDWKGNSEAMLLYLMALGSDTHPVDAKAWDFWTSGYDASWGTLYGQEYLTFTPLFGHQFTQTWFPLRGVRDAYMRAKGLDHFENTRRATYSHRQYAIENPHGWTGYGADMWGLSACDGPVDKDITVDGTTRRFRTYAARGFDVHETVDDGTIATSGALSSLPFAPEIVIPMVDGLARRHGKELIGKYGFFEAFNPTFTFTDVTLRHGHVIPGFGWVDKDWVGIDQGPIVAMIENYRTGLVWRTMQRNRHVRQGLVRAGFTGGWLDEGAGAH